MKTPEVRIYFSWMLYDRVSVHLHELFGKGEELITKEQAEDYTENYRQAWSKFEDRILPALVEVLGVEFYRPVIDVPCAPWMWSISDPLTMGFQFFPDQFVDQLTHELCHVLLTDNTKYSMRSSKKVQYLDERWKKLFGKEHDFDTLAHIPVHALCKYIYLDILKDPKRLERDVEMVRVDPSYEAAWDYVDEHDYKEIIKQLKGDYAAIAEGRD